MIKSSENCYSHRDPKASEPYLLQAGCKLHPGALTTEGGRRRSANAESHENSPGGNSPLCCYESRNWAEFEKSRRMLRPFIPIASRNPVLAPARLRTSHPGRGEKVWRFPASASCGSG